jgi:hypothetical protein
VCDVFIISRCEFTQAALQACTRNQAWETEREGWRKEKESLERGKRVLQQRVADLLEVLLLQLLLLRLLHADD